MYNLYITIFKYIYIYMTHSLDPFTSLQILRSMCDTHRMTFTDPYRHWANFVPHHVTKF